MEFKRGMMYYIKNGKNYMNGTGKARPGIIVSKDIMNTTSDRVMVIYLTTTNNKVPQNVPVMVKSTQSYAICNNIETIYKDKLENAIGMVSDAEIKEIDKQLMDCLSLSTADQKSDDWKNKPLCIGCEQKDRYAEMKQRAEKAEMESNFYNRKFNELLDKMMDRVG